jgi:S-(hydroxymethyl)glutathione dehydrogenase / alcohol dehydrogenase
MPETYVAERSSRRAAQRLGLRQTTDMRAAVLRSCPGDLEIEDLTLGAVGPREVLIRTAAAGLCHSDLHFMQGKHVLRPPAVMGHESAGVVEKVGDDVRYVAPGDHVITCLSMFCGTCDYCLTGRPYLCEARELRRSGRLAKGDEKVGQFAGLGSFAEEMLVHENAVVKVTPDMPLDVAALIGCGVMTGVGAVFYTAQVAPGSTVAVIGCGGIGLNAVQGARLAGAGRIIAVDVLPAKLELARQFGATDTVDGSGGSAVEQVVELTSGGVDYAFEAIGSKATAEQALMMVRRGGTAYIIGMVPLNDTVEVPSAALLSGKRLEGCVMGSNRFRLDMPRLVDLYLQGRLLLDELVSARIGLDDINDGFKVLATGAVARNVVVFS